jgi:hypothetical protein
LDQIGTRIEEQVKEAFIDSLYAAVGNGHVEPPPRDAIAATAPEPTAEPPPEPTADDPKPRRARKASRQERFRRDVGTHERHPPHYIAGVTQLADALIEELTYLPMTRARERQVSRAVYAKAAEIRASRAHRMHWHDPTIDRGPGIRVVSTARLGEALRDLIGPSQEV